MCPPSVHKLHLRLAGLLYRNELQRRARVTEGSSLSGHHDRPSTISFQSLFRQADGKAAVLQTVPTYIKRLPAPPPD